MNLEIARLANLAWFQLARGRSPLPTIMLFSGLARGETGTLLVGASLRLPVLDWSATLFDDAGPVID